MQRYWLVAVVFFVILLAVFMNRQSPQQVTTPPDQKGIAAEEQKLEDDSPGKEDLTEETKEAVASNEHIVLLEPAPSTSVPSPFTVRGEARDIPGNVLSVRIVNKDGSTAVSLNARVRGGDDKTFGTFEIKNLSYAFTSGEEKTLEVFAKGDQGEELYKLSIPLRFTLVD